jgi:hypothetical protein
VKLALLFLASFPALAQTLTPAEPPTDWKGYGVWLLIAVVVVGIIFFVKHHPTSVASALALLHKQADTHAQAIAAIQPPPAAAGSQPPPTESASAAPPIHKPDPWDKP